MGKTTDKIKETAGGIILKAKESAAMVKEKANRVVDKVAGVRNLSKASYESRKDKNFVFEAAKKFGVNQLEFMDGDLKTDFDLLISSLKEFGFDALQYFSGNANYTKEQYQQILGLISREDKFTHAKEIGKFISVTCGFDAYPDLLIGLLDECNVAIFPELYQAEKYKNVDLLYAVIEKYPIVLSYLTNDKDFGKYELHEKEVFGVFYGKDDKRFEAIDRRNLERKEIVRGLDFERKCFELNKESLRYVSKLSPREVMDLVRANGVETLQYLGDLRSDLNMLTLALEEFGCDVMKYFSWEIDYTKEQYEEILSCISTEDKIKNAKLIGDYFSVRCGFDAFPELLISLIDECGVKIFPKVYQPKQAKNVAVLYAVVKKYPEILQYLVKDNEFATYKLSDKEGVIMHRGKDDRALEFIDRRNIKREDYVSVDDFEAHCVEINEDAKQYCTTIGDLTV